MPVFLYSRIAKMSARLVVACGAAALLAGPAPAQAPGLAMLDGLEKGRWVLRDLSDTPGVQGDERSLCLGEARQMIQLEHARGGCSRYVINDQPREVTVHYTCPGMGHGRTTIRRETDRLVQIDTQGIVGAAPFSHAYEARRVGDC